MTTATIEHAGRRFRMDTFGPEDHISRKLLSGAFYETDVLDRIREHHIPGTTFVDVGANIGNHTVYVAGVLGAPTHAFEPQPAAFELLRANVTGNHLTNVTLHPCGLADRPGEATLVPGLAGNRGMAKLIPGGSGVALRTLDGFVLGGPIGTIKIDVEGMETAVLRGARRTIRRHLPDLLLEAATTAEFRAMAAACLALGYVPAGRYAWTPTYRFVASDQAERFRRLLRPRRLLSALGRWCRPRDLNPGLAG
jgi:FkbM family methyltransferase